MRITQQVLSQSKFACYVAVVALTLLYQATPVHALGLGGIHVLSRLGQPFAAEIDLINVGRDDLASLKVNLAPPTAYAAANLRFDPALNALRLSVERRANGTPYVRAVSSRTVTEPYLDVLVEMTTQEGKFQRAYTALLDLPDSPAPVAAAAPAAKAEAEPARAPAPPRAVRKPPAADGVTAAAPAPAGPPAARPAARPPATSAVPGKNVPAKAEPAPAEPVRPEAAKPDKPALPKAEAAVTEPPKAEAPASDLTKEAAPAAQAPQPDTTEPAKVASAEPLAPPAKTTGAPLAPSRSFGDFVSANALSLGGGALALLAAIAGLWAWSRRSPTPEAPVPAPSEPVLQAPTPRAAAPAAVAPLPAAPSGEASPPDLSVAAVTDIVDPIDEAKVHLDYGQSDQAEKILREALSKQPGREDIQLLLLEILAGRRDNDGFNQLAGRIHRQTGGLGEHWKRVMAMGYALDPGYALYSPTEGAHGALAPAQDQRSDLVSVPVADDSAADELEKTMVLPRRPARPSAEPLPDLAFELPAGVAAAETPAVTPDHPGLDFKVDLPASTPQPEIAAEATALSDSQHEEVQKKLMLARAYREMGDKEGALELLREVEREGDAAQLAEMREIMQTLD